MDIAAQAAQLSQSFPRDLLDPAAVATADASAARNEGWVVALSGGADSVALALLLWAHWPGQRARLSLAHFNHRLRGAESAADEAFCRAFAAKLGVPLEVGCWNEAPRDPSEEEAREARYSFFQSVAAGRQARTLFTGHQLDDIAETQLMRLARGASAGGLAAPRPVRTWKPWGEIVRPLLGLRKSELAAGLRAAGFDWREDSSNAGHAYLRNRVRHTVVPCWLQAAGSRGLEGAALTRRWLEEDDDALEAWVDTLGIPRGCERLDLRILAGKPAAVWRRALRRWAPAAGLSRSGFDELLTRLRAGSPGSMSVGTGFAELRDGQLSWRQPAGAPDPMRPGRLSAGGILLLPDGSELTANEIRVDPPLLACLARGAVNPDTTAFVAEDADFVVRSWEPGDCFRPLGAPGTAKLQDLFTNRRIPAPRRHRLPVVCAADGRILWVPGFPPAESSKLTDVSVTAVQLTYVRGTSTVTDYS